MIAHLLVEQQFANANRKNDSLENFTSPSIICRVDPNVYATSFDSAESFSINQNLEQFTKNQNQSLTPDIQEWTSELEKKFRRLAEAKALNKLSLKGKVEFEKLMSLRRQVKNPRTGEDVLVEYQQRMLTKKLVSVLAEYVNFHKLSHQSGKAA